MFDAETVYTSVKDSCNDSEVVVVYQNIHRVGNSDSLFYTSVIMGDSVKMGGMLDSGSMACSINEAAETKLRDAGVITDQKLMDVNVVLVGCGGLRVKPKCAFEVEMEVYGCKVLVPTLIIPGQHDELILGTNVIKHILHQSKLCESYWETVSGPCPDRDPEAEHFLSMLSGLNIWRGEDVPVKIGTVRSNSATCLEPGREYLIWGKLPKNTAVSPGSTFKDAHPLPHQADCLAALGGNCFFSTMDLTSGFYNMPLHEDDRKYSAFTTPMGLYEYNRLPQGLCNSPGSFMRMWTSIFGDQNYLSLLCYLDDLLVFAPDEETALLRLRMVFDRLRSHNLKLAPKKCFFLRRSVKFLGHIIDENGVSTSNNSQSACSPLCIHTQSVEVEDVSAVLQSHIAWDVGPRARAVSVLQHLPQLVPPGQDSLPAYTEKELRDKQLADGTLSRVLSYVERRRRPSRRERFKESVYVTRYLKHWDRLTVSNGVLYRVSKDQKTKAKRFQYVVPDSLKPDVLQGIHDGAGHQAQSRSLSLARQRFFWPNLDRDVRDYVRHCQRCIVSKTVEPEGRAPLESIMSTRPLELVCIDFWSAEDSKNRSVDVLVITDHFTQMAQAFPCKDQTAKQVARVLWDRYFCVFGFPERIHSDQGANFESRLISELLKVSGVRKSHTPPYGKRQCGTFQ